MSIKKGYINYKGYIIPDLNLFNQTVHDFKKPAILGYSDMYVIHPKYGYRVEYYPDDGDKIIKAFQAAFKKIPKCKYISGTATRKGFFKIFVKRPQDYYTLVIALLDVHTDESVDLAAELLENVGFEIEHA